MTTTLLHQMALSQVPGIGPVLAKNLIAYCGGAEGVFHESEAKLIKIPGIGLHAAREINSFSNFDELHKEFEFMEKNDVQATFFTDTLYPYRLKQIPDAPILIYHKGCVDLNAKKAIAVIGTRKCSDHSKAYVNTLLDGLLEFNPLIISGLAYGVDAVAHRSALKLGLDTVGVLGHGLDRVYPGQHTSLANRMVEQGGLLTEFKSHTNPDRENFPKRNRIVAGLSDAVLVVETPEKGGSMITANLAFGYDREVMALPGRAGEASFGGCNSLIKTNRAHLVETADDIATILNWDLERKDKPAQIKMPLNLSSEEQTIFDALKGKGQLHIDLLCQTTQISASKLAIRLLELEFQNVVRSLPGKRYELI